MRSVASLECDNNLVDESVSDSSGSSVEEVQGLYGPFQFPELLLQRIWAERSFRAKDARTESRETVKIIRPGRWNRQEGPDFKQAEIQIDGRPVHGEVEMHLREPDWQAHAHAVDRNYDNVVLHVVLFPPKRPTTAGANGPIPILVLLPLLWHDLEEYAADAAVSAIADRPAERLAQAWLELSAQECRVKIVAEAKQRWLSKVHYAQIRITRLGWTDACHHTALEILGYRFNRATMLTVASRWPLEEWGIGDVAPDEVFDEMIDVWKLGAVRPANHPRRRLQAYARWTKQVPDWPDQLVEQAKVGLDAPADASPTSDVADLRRNLGLKRQWARIMTAVGVGGNVTQPRADNLWGDGFLPLLVASGQLTDEIGYLWWFMSWPGDQAANLTAAARLIGVADGKRNPLAWGHVQGLIGQQLRSPETGAEGDLTSDFTSD